MSDYKYVPTVGNVLALRDDAVVARWSARHHDEAVKYLHTGAMGNPQHNWRLVQVIAEVERGAPIMHTLMDDKS